jgi:RNA polymerase sigma factor for flagellar operon FliA
MRAATRAEIAREMGITEDELVKWETAFQANTPQSLDAVYDQFSIWFASDNNTPEEQLSERELQDVVKDGIRSLPEREALVIQLYYVEELNVFEIAEVLDVSTGRVSQIKKSAIMHLREFIEKANGLAE